MLATLFLSKVCKTKALRPPLHASHGVATAWIIDWRWRSSEQEGMRRKSRRRTGCSFELLGVHGLVFALTAISECKEPRAREFLPLHLSPCLHLRQIKRCFVSDFSGPFVLWDFSGRSHALLLPQTPALVSGLFSLTTELRFQFEMSKWSLGPPLGVQIGLFRLSDPSRNPRAHLIPFNVVSPLVCFLPVQGFTLLILNRMWD